MSARLRAVPLGATWFDRPEYAPRLAGATDRWFLADPSFPRAHDWPAAVSHGPAPVDPRARVRSFLETRERWSLRSSPAEARSLELLEDPATEVVITGQQPGFLGGPLYTLYKAATTIAAARVSTRSGRPAVPVFWVAAEDHDLDEIRAVHWPGAEGTASLEVPLTADRRPVDDYAVTPEVESVLDAAVRALAGRPGSSRVHELIDLYRGRTLASGYGALLGALFGRHGLLVIDPRSLRPLARGLVRRVIESPHDALDAIRRGGAALRERGLRPIVADRFPLFLLRDRPDLPPSRDHLSPAGDGFVIDGTSDHVSAARLLEILETTPERISTGALLRPIVQDALLPVALSVGGPAEIAYATQTEELAAWLGVARAPMAPRLQATLLDGRTERLWQRLQLTPERFAAATRPEGLLPASPPSRLSNAAAALIAAAREVTSLSAVESKIDEASRRGIERAAQKLIEGGERLAERVERAEAQSEAALWSAAESLWARALPDGRLQERRWNALHWISTHGEEWIDDLIRVAEDGIFDVRHLVLFLEEEPSS